MKKKWLITALVALVAVLVLAAPATALEGNCGTISFTLAPNQGPGGTQVTASGSGVMPDFPFGIYWESISGDLLVSGTSTTGGDYSAVFNIPADAATGAHDVVFFGTQDNEQPAACTRVFTVTAATAGGGVQPDAYTQSRTNMPETGAFLLPAGLLAAAGAGLLLARRRR